MSFRPSPSGENAFGMKIAGTMMVTVRQIVSAQLYRSSTLTKSVVFSKGWTTSGNHQVRVIVVGTSGHPRVDLDAFVVAR